MDKLLCCPRTAHVRGRHIQRVFRQDPALQPHVPHDKEGG